MSAHFTLAELACKCGCGMLPQPSSVNRLEKVRERCGFPFKVTSGARCPKHNNEVSHTGDNGPHTHGQAFDIETRGAQALRIVDVALEEGFTGIGVSQKGDSRFIHIDDLPNADGQPRPWIWSY